MFCVCPKLVVGASGIIYVVNFNISQTPDTRGLICAMPSMKLKSSRIKSSPALLRCVGVCPYTSAMQSRSLSFVNVLGADRLPTHIFYKPSYEFFFFCAMMPNRLIAKKKKRAGNGVYTRNKRDADVLRWECAYDCRFYEGENLGQ